MSIPSGKGAFIRTVVNLPGLARQMWSAGFTWAAPFGEVLVRQMPEYANLFHAKGIKLYPCIYTRPGMWPMDLDLMIRAARTAGGAGLLINAEAEFKGREEEAEEMMLAAKATPYTVGLTSYGEPRFHRSFPWRIFAQHTDFGVAQVYDKHGDRPQSVAEGLEQWRSHGFHPVMGCPSGQLVSREAEPEMAKPVGMFEEHLKQFPVSRGACFWLYPGIETHLDRYREQWKAMTRFKVGPGLLVSTLPFGQWAFDQIFG